MQKRAATLSSKTIEQITSEIEAIAEESYRNGWADAIAAIKSAADSAISHNRWEAVAPKEMKKRNPKSSGSKSGNISVVDGLAEYANNNPGLRASDLIRGFKSETGLDFHDVYGRTALNRLDKRGILERKNGLWYGAKNMTANASQSDATLKTAEKSQGFDFTNSNGHVTGE